MLIGQNLSIHVEPSKIEEYVVSEKMGIINEERRIRQLSFISGKALIFLL
jgi:hypothetical protein